ncbi:MAG: hypothetical protein BWY66_00452 [bacterium ADurb.Bin374]|nr:MAG: hypothetical protein BWY66_00452 [bacterium ADurb.Bin374]
MALTELARYLPRSDLRNRFLRGGIRTKDGAFVGIEDGDAVLHADRSEHADLHAVPVSDAGIHAHLVAGIKIVGCDAALDSDVFRNGFHVRPCSAAVQHRDHRLPLADLDTGEAADCLQLLLRRDRADHLGILRLDEHLRKTGAAGISARAAVGLRKKRRDLVDQRILGNVEFPGTPDEGKGKQERHAAHDQDGCQNFTHAYFLFRQRSGGKRGGIDPFGRCMLQHPQRPQASASELQSPGRVARSC